MSQEQVHKAVRVAMNDVAVNRGRGGELRVLLGPATVGASSGFLGVATLRPAEVIREHYHPYSEEFLYVVSGVVTATCADERFTLEAGYALFVPVGVRHRIVGVRGEPASLVFALSPLAPRPDLGHVDTEPDTAGGAR